MTDHPSSPHDRPHRPPSAYSAGPTRTSHPSWWQRRPARWLLASAAFVLGLFGGGIIVGFAGSGSPTPSSTPSVQTVILTATTTLSAPSTAGGLTGQATVNQACVEVITDAQSAYAALTDLGSALRGLNPSKIDQVIQRLEPLQDRLRTDLRDCRVALTLPDGSATTETTITPTPPPPSS